MIAVILAGGLGTRLSEETGTIPKPMIDIGGRPLLWHLMKYLSQFGINKFVVPLGYKSDVIKHYFLKYSELQSDLSINLANGTVSSRNSVGENWEVELVDTGLETMTGGRLKRVSDRLNETFLFTYGDGLSDVDIGALVEFHRAHGKLATVTAVKPVSRFGILKVADNSEVLTFAEKPEDSKDVINGGFFILEPGVLDLIDDDSTIWEHEPCERLVKRGQMMAYRHPGFWQCVDTLYEYKLVRRMWEEGTAAWKLWE